MAPVRRALLVVVILALAAGTAGAVRLPGVKTPTRNISCFWVPQAPTRHGSLLCDIRHAAYTGALQKHCISPPIGLDWHGFSLSETRRGEVVCAGGMMYDARDKPTYAVLRYGKTWRYRGFTCVSRVTGLTCKNRAGHGLFLSRATFGLF